MFFLTVHLIAQNGYQTTLLAHPNNSFSIALVPNFNSDNGNGNPVPVIGQMSFKLLIPNDATFTRTFFLGDQVAQEQINDLDISQMGDLQTNANDFFNINIQGGTVSLPAHHTIGEIIPVYTFTLNNISNSGTLELLDNSTIYATTLPTFFTTSVTMDLTDDAEFNPDELFLERTNTVENGDFIYDFSPPDNGYQITLIDNLNYSFTIALVPNFSSDIGNNAPVPVIGQMSFKLLVPDNATFVRTFFLGDQVAQEQINDLDISQMGDLQTNANDFFNINIQGGMVSLPTHHDSGDVIPVYSFTLNNMPDYGTLELLDNNTEYAITLPAFFTTSVTMDLSDDITFNPEEYFIERTDAVENGGFFYDFATLSSTDYSQDISILKIYPNPVKDTLYLEGAVEMLDQIMIYDILGRLVIRQQGKDTRIQTQLLSKGHYTLKVFFKNGLTKTFKFLKQ